ncbi:tRNA pseudouridine(55) synthase TruB [Candidatus Saccharibacteria bacterium]|nr:tRNA pseudouridine(55) synthase TruB [Candidatus Saccharibacteria bacterium]
MDGILLVDKPRGLTSHDVVAKVRSILRREISNQQLENRLIPNSKLLVSTSLKVRVGHTGTLDPLASGLLILVLGSYTKRASEFSKLDKTYEVELTLGYSSKTGDAEGPITAKSNKQIAKSKVEKVLESFVGEIKQVPHAHSAVKVGGQRAYKLARAGKKPELKSRQVTVHRLQVTDYKYPKLRFVTEVSSGTYIRSLAEDIGQKLGTGAYVSALRRTKVGKFDVKNASNIDKLSKSSIIDLMKEL